MRAYKVFLIVKAGQSTDHSGLFFETAIDHKGTIVQVVPGGRGAGMRLQRQTESALDPSWDDDRKDHIGWVMEAKFDAVWQVVRSVPPPGQKLALCRTAREWTEKVMRALQRAGVMENSRESEATVHEETEDTDASTIADDEPRHMSFLTREESESEISEEE